MSSVLSAVKNKLLPLLKAEDLLGEEIFVSARVLSTEEAIGDPEGDDFPLQHGKERLMEAVFHGARGQAFTDRFGDFSGTLGQIASMELDNNFRRAVFVATLNAVARHLGLAEGTVHCRDEGPRDCAAALADHVAENYGAPRVAQVGFQPAFAGALGQRFELRVLDLDPDNIGQTRRGVLIEGPEATDDALAWADLVVSTGSTLVNDTLGDVLGRKATLLYGTTVAGAAALMGWDRFCARSS